MALTGTLLAAAGLALARAWRDSDDAARRAGSLRAAAVLVVGTLAVPVVGTVARWPLAGPSLTEGGPTRTVAVVQGNVPRAGLDFNEQRRAVLDNHVRETQELAAQVARGEVAQPDLVIWPENSSDIDPYLNDDAAAAIDRRRRPSTRRSWWVRWSAARAGSCPTPPSCGTRRPGRGDLRQAAPGPAGRVRAGASFFRFFSDKVDLVRADFRAGTEVGTLDMAGTTIGDVICFEVAYDGLVHDTVEAGRPCSSSRPTTPTSGSPTRARSSWPWAGCARSRPAAAW